MLNEAQKQTILNLNADWQPGRLLVLLYGGITLGVTGFLTGLLTGRTEVWQFLLINTVFFSGLAYGCLLFSAMLTITRARWGRPIKRLAEATVFFIPVSWLLFGGLMLGMPHLFLWIDPNLVDPAKRWWLNRPFFVSRQLGMMLLTGLVAMAYVASTILTDWQASSAAHQKRHHRLAPLLGILYSLMACLIGIDWIMSINPNWVSTLFGVQYAFANLYAAAAFLILFSALVNRRWKLDAWMTADRHKDLARFLLAASLFWSYLVFSQLLVIWYANIPEETGFLMQRLTMDGGPAAIQLLGLVLFLLPLLGLLSRSACRSRPVTAVIAALVLIGLWVEKALLILPSIHCERPAAAEASLSLWQISITLGVGAAFLLSVVHFVKRFPVMPLSDPLLEPAQSRPFWKVTTRKSAP